MTSHSVRSILFEAVRAAAQDVAVRADVIANHDNNRWWPTRVQDWRLRLLFAGWSTRVSYNMIHSFQRTIAEAEQLGFDALATMTNTELTTFVSSLGMASTRVRYFRSIQSFVEKTDQGLVEDPRTASNENAIAAIRANVWGASYKVAQCAVLYVKGYHCGIFPVDSGMVTMLGPCLGLRLSRGDVAHEEMRKIVEECVQVDAQLYRQLVNDLGYADEITIPTSPPVWWVHLVLIYYKRRFCNRHQPDACALREASRGQHIGSMCSHADPARGGVRRLIIEGVDGVGKSSAAKMLGEHGFAVRHFPHDPKQADLEEAYRSRIQCAGALEIWDRSFISEYVYGTALRGASRVSLEAVLALARLYVNQGGAIALLDANEADIKLRLQEDGRPSEFNSARHRTLCAQYGIVGAMLREAGLATVFDTSGKSASDVGTWMAQELVLWRPN